jgi:hypothetical protein
MLPRPHVETGNCISEDAFTSQPNCQRATTGQPRRERVVLAVFSGCFCPCWTEAESERFASFRNLLPPSVGRFPVGKQ